MSINKSKISNYKFHLFLVNLVLHDCSQNSHTFLYIIRVHCANLLDEVLDVDVCEGGFKLGGVLLDV